MTTSDRNDRSEDRPGKLRPVFLFVAVLLVALVVSAERLPIRTWGPADGLPQGTLRDVFPDSSGFLWIAADGGLVRFDGSRFLTFREEDGLPSRVVLGFLETSSGERFFATARGVVRLVTSAKVGEKKFEEIPSNLAGGTDWIGDFLQDRAGTIWCGGRRGLFRLETSPSLRLVAVPLARAGSLNVSSRVRGLLEDPIGRGLWIATPDGIDLWDRSGPLIPFADATILGPGPVGSLARVRSGRTFALVQDRLHEIDLAARSPKDFVVRSHRVSEWGGRGLVIDLVETPDGELWASGGGALARLPSPSSPLVAVRRAEGLSDEMIQGIASDDAGNLWVTSESGGLMRFSRSGWSSFGKEDGLQSLRVITIVESNAGDVVVNPGGDPQRLQVFDGKRFRDQLLRYPKELTYLGWGWNQWNVQDSRNVWWAPSGQGLLSFGSAHRVEELAGRSPVAWYRRADGLPADDLFRLYEDSGGALWVSGFGNEDSVLARRDPATGRFLRVTSEEGTPALAATAFGEDCAGNVWIGFWNGELLRFRQGRFEKIVSSDRALGFVSDLHLDDSGRLWAAGAKKLARIDGAENDAPSISILGETNGLAPGPYRTLTSDRFGRLYIGSWYGIDRLDPETGRVRRFTTENGLPNDVISVSIRARDGSLWFGTLQGVARLVPRRDLPRHSPRIYVDSLTIAGEPTPVSILGATEMALGAVPLVKNRLEIALVAPDFAPGARVRFEYRFAEVDSAWTPVSADGRLSLAALAAGSYAIEARAVTSDGLVSDRPARISFEIVPPIWRRPRFVVSLVLLSLVAVFLAVAMRFRAARRREIELARVVAERTRDLEAARAELIGANESLERRVSEGIEKLRESERFAAWGRLVATVAHEIRHPIFAIRAIAYVLADRVRADESLAKQVKTIERETQRMTTFMNELLEFARPRALDVAPADVPALLNEAVETYRSETDPSKLAVEVNVDSAPTHFPLDRGRLLQVLVNLMQNAFKHADGAAYIRLTASDREGHLRLEVENDGEPIPEENRTRLFEPFFTTGKGSGLGLAIVQRIVNDHGGTIHVEAPAPGGTRFVIDLPKR